MAESINNIFQTSYIPHGHCYLWQTPLVGLHTLSDAMIALSYYSIPLTLIYFIRNRQDIPFKGIFVMFSAFIILCGTTHLMAVVTLWYPWYWFSGLLKASTALISIYTAFSLYSIIPLALTMASPQELENLNKKLEKEVEERRIAQEQILQLNLELEKRVETRTHELKETNKKLKESQDLTQKITDLTPCMLYIYDLEKKQNIYFNNFIEETLKYERNSIQLTSIIPDLVHNDDRQIMAKHLEKCSVLAPDNYLEIDYRIQDLHNKWRWIHTRDTPFEYNPDGIVTKILGLAVDITERKNIELELRDVNIQLADKIAALETRHQEMIQLGKFNDFLSICLSLDEVITVLPDLICSIFPDTSGAIFMNNIEDDLLVRVVFWGEEKYSSLYLTSEQCWGLRRGNLYTADKAKEKLFCHHLQEQFLPNNSLCVPLTAQGKNIGLFSIFDNNNQLIQPQKKSLLETLSKQIALAFANINIQEDLHNQSLKDSLTNLYNRRYLEKYLHKEISKSLVNKTSLGLAMIDVDRFKCVNDTYGHPAGDYVLQQLAHFLNTQVTDKGIACRYGGEEMTLVFTQIDSENLEQQLEKIRKQVKNLDLYYEGKRLDSISVSIGFALCPDHGTNVTTIIKKADQALYNAKNAGRDCLKIYKEN